MPLNFGRVGYQSVCRDGTPERACYYHSAAAARGVYGRSTTRRGGVLVETALVLPIILMMVMGLFDHCRAIMVQQLVINAAREGARQAAANTSTMTTANVQATVTQALAGQRFSSLNISVYQVDPTTGNNLGPWNNTPAGSSIAVQVKANYTPMLSPFSLLPSSIAIEATSIMTSEAN